MIFPALSMLGNTPEDFDLLTVIIILTMVLLSGTLRFVQESRSGNAAEKLLAMIPCDVRILKAKDFIVSESSLIGESEGVEKTFSKDVNSVSWVLIRFMFVMVPVVFVINGITKGDWLQAFFFAISIMTVSVFLLLRTKQILLLLENSVWKMKRIWFCWATLHSWILQRNLRQKQSVHLKIMEWKQRFLQATTKKLPAQYAVRLD